jgi:hypothetical protein
VPNDRLPMRTILGAPIHFVAEDGEPVHAPLILDRTGDPPAMIGQDLLRGTVVAVGPDASTPVFWQVVAV